MGTTENIETKNKNCVADTLTHSFECKICGGKESFPEFPVEISEFTRISKNFMKKHQTCKIKN